MLKPVPVPVDIPILETERLRLRGHRANDFAAVAAMWSDPIVNRYTTGKPLASDDAWGKALRNAGLWPVLGYGYWVIEEKATGEFVGETGFADFHRQIEPPLTGMPEMGWVLLSQFHGKGYATEATRAAINWGDEHITVKPMCCIIHVENAVSVRLAHKLGFRESHRSAYKNHDVIVMLRDVAA